MEFYDLLKQYKDFDFETLWANTTEDQILRILQKPKKDPEDFAALLAPAAQSPNVLEAMAAESQSKSVRWEKPLRTRDSAIFEPNPPHPAIKTFTLLIFLSCSLVKYFWSPHIKELSFSFVS